MPRGFLTLAGVGLAVLVAIQGAQAVDWKTLNWGGPTAAFAASAGLLDGCADVPEAVALAEDLRLRGIGIDRALESLARRKDEIAAAEARLKTRLVELRETRKALADNRAGQQAGTDRGIDRLIAVYDAMKPADAARVMAALPPDFAAEILARVQPETGARIIAAIEPAQAAMLTAHLGARRLPAE